MTIDKNSYYDCPRNERYDDDLMIVMTVNHVDI